ncbi:hypothetical protein BJY00DRAFT_273325 [Aspergillus carlsbadensis]|nr:hypothetical protein BJY00DRAFT_273325 [Aspergillus carlsbadensis]
MLYGTMTGNERPFFCPLLASLIHIQLPRLLTTPILWALILPVAKLSRMMFVLSLWLIAVVLVVEMTGFEHNKLVVLATIVQDSAG